MTCSLLHSLGNSSEHLMHPGHHLSAMWTVLVLCFLIVHRNQTSDGSPRWPNSETWIGHFR